MSKFTFTSHVTAHAKAAVKTDGLMAKACDAMIADEITVAMFSKKTDDSDRAEDFRNGLKAAIVASFTVADQRLLDTPTRDCQTLRKSTSVTCSMQIGARVNDYKRGLERRVYCEGPAKKGRGPEADNDRTFCAERLTAIIKRLRKGRRVRSLTLCLSLVCRVALGKVQAKI
jgi:hypothetical protein